MKLGMKLMLAIPLLGALAAFPASDAGAEETILNYNVDLVSDYVYRGSDVHRSVYIGREEEETPFNVAPAVQPSVTFYSTSGIWVNFWASFALTDRDEKSSPNPATGDTFGGLKTLDELDTSIGYDWENRLGSFSARIVNIAAIHPDAQGEGDETAQEMRFSWERGGITASEPLRQFREGPVSFGCLCKAHRSESRPCFRGVVQVTRRESVCTLPRPQD